VKAPEPQPVDDALELLEERLDAPERGIVRTRRLTAPELVVERDPAPRRQPVKPGERQMRAARPTVEAEEREPSRLLEVPEDPRCRSPLAERDRAL